MINLDRELCDMSGVPYQPAASKKQPAIVRRVVRISPAHEVYAQLNKEDPASLERVRSAITTLGTRYIYEFHNFTPDPVTVIGRDNFPQLFLPQRDYVPVDYEGCFVFTKLIFIRNNEEALSLRQYLAGAIQEEGDDASKTLAELLLTSYDGTMLVGKIVYVFKQSDILTKQIFYDNVTDYVIVHGKLGPGESIKHPFFTQELPFKPRKENINSAIIEITYVNNVNSNDRLYVSLFGSIVELNACRRETIRICGKKETKQLDAYLIIKIPKAVTSGVKYFDKVVELDVAEREYGVFSTPEAARDYGGWRRRQEEREKELRQAHALQLEQQEAEFKRQLREREHQQRVIDAQLDNLAKLEHAEKLRKNEQENARAKAALEMELARIRAERERIEHAHAVELSNSKNKGESFKFWAGLAGGAIGLGAALWKVFS